MITLSKQNEKEKTTTTKNQDGKNRLEAHVPTLVSITIALSIKRV